MCKLVLYSEQRHEESVNVDLELVNLFNKKNPCITYISSFSDLSRKYFNKKVELYKNLGIENVQYFDLDLGYHEARIGDILNSDAIQLGGGNTFTFLSLMKKRNFIKLLQDYVAKGGILIGISAGSMIMSNTIDIAGYGENKDENIVGIVDKSGLGLIDFDFFPHWSGNDKSLDSIRPYLKATNKIAYACKNGDGIIINNGNIKFIGDVVKVE